MEASGVHPDILNQLYQQMDLQISLHSLLIEEMKKEAECLRKGSTESLIPIVHSIEHHTKTIHRLSETIEETIGKVLTDSGRGEEERTLSRLLPFLPSSHRKRIKLYQGALTKLRAWIGEANELNKAFAREALSHLRDLIGLLIHPARESSGYIRNGKRGPSISLPSSLNRQI